jgi:hypothetical protein
VQKLTIIGQSFEPGDAGCSIVAMSLRPFCFIGGEEWIDSEWHDGNPSQLNWPKRRLWAMSDAGRLRIEQTLGTPTSIRRVDGMIVVRCWRFDR